MRWLAPLALLLALASCAPGPGIAQRMDAQMGRTELEIVRQYGVPTSSIEIEGRRFLRWTQSSTDVYPGGPWMGPWPYGYGYGYYGSPPMVVNWTCDLEIEFAREDPAAQWRAVSWRTRGNDCG